MNCREFEKQLFALAHQRMLDEAMRKQRLSHADACARCAARLLEARLMVEGVRTVAAELTGEGAPARVEAALLDAFRNRQAAPVIVMPDQMTPRIAHWKSMALAAGLLILFSLVVFSWQQAREVGQQAKNFATASAPAADSESAAPVPPESIKGAMSVRPANRSKGRAVHQPGARSPRAERVTEFFPLMEGEEGEVLESGQIVRIELSSAALLEAGFPVEVAMTSAPIKADVVLGEDGMARAIRFVRQ